MLDRLFPTQRKKDGDAPARSSELAELFDEFFRSPVRFPLALGSLERGRAPAVDLSDSGDEVVLTAELPGLAPEDVQLTLERGVLTIAGEKKAEFEEKKESRIRRERSYGAFRRTVPLPCGVVEDAITATFDKGVLTVRMPKDACRRPRKIEISG